MRVLLDENIPEQLVSEFAGHECKHVVSMGWAGEKNGALIAKAEEAGFNVLVTLDSSIPLQNDLTSKRLAIIILKPLGQGLRATRALMPDILLALESCQAGAVITLSNRTA